MGFSKISTLSLTDLFVQQIETMILSGELAVGEQLPAARELSVRMGVSRPVISAGIVELEKLGFVEIHPRQGVFVCDYRRKGTLETLVAIMRYNGGAMRRNEVRSLLEVRSALECLCVRQVIEHASDAELAALSPLLTQIETATTGDAAAEAAFLFHHELAVLSGNNLLPLLYHSFRPEGIHLWTLYCKYHSIAALHTLKENLYRALLDRNEEDAIIQTNQIMDNAINDLSRYGV
ncbi:MAG: GntR family transcriptional regulator [Eubacteriales bacterium]|nr:GntR family transcriptional regulator [Eubacteriales bacterium]